jgi:hypothetical protein
MPLLQCCAGASSPQGHTWTGLETCPAAVLLAPGPMRLLLGRTEALLLLTAVLLVLGRPAATSWQLDSQQNPAEGLASVRERAVQAVATEPAAAQRHVGCSAGCCVWCEVLLLLLVFCGQRPALADSCCLLPFLLGSST